MNPIYHDDEPDSGLQWRESDYRPEHRVGSLARLKPEMYASYVFLHYQLQEETSRKFNQYYFISSFEQYIFSYQEMPERVRTPRKGKLATHNTPENWGAAMHPHFELWENREKNEQIWHVLEEIISADI